MILTHKSGQTQALAIADLTKGGAATLLELAAGRPCELVYSDPPWSPGNEKWWRRHAGEEPPRAYEDLLNGWCSAVVGLRPTRIIVEQSVNPDHQGLLLRAIERCEGWAWPLQQTWTPTYGSPKRPHATLHFGTDKLGVDVNGEHGEASTKAIFHALNLWGSLVADPCTGLGMSSREAHLAGADFIGTELNPKRLERTIGWLKKHGYEDAE